MFGRSPKVLQELIDDAVAAEAAASNDELSVYVLSNGWAGGWEKALSKKARPVEVSHGKRARFQAQTAGKGSPERVIGCTVFLISCVAVARRCGQ